MKSMKKSSHPIQKSLVVEPQKILRFCTCGQSHPTMEVRYYIGNDAFDLLADDARRFLLQGSALVLSDENTHTAAGASVAARLKVEAVRHRVLTLPAGVRATEAQAQKVADASRGHDLILAVGAGTVNDLGKYAAGKRGIPYWAVPTAPSMNGYTSAIAAIKVAGVKRTLSSPPPQFIYIHPETIRNSPLRLRQAGYCDVMAKSVSDIDWQIESLLFSGSYCRLSAGIVAENENTYLDHPEELRQGRKKVTMELLKGLLVSGAAMTLAGSSAPASGGEHLFSHFLDMREGLTGRTPSLHGFQVAGGIVVSACCYRRLAALVRFPGDPRPEGLLREQAEQIPEVWGDLALEVGNRFALKRKALLKLGKLLQQRWEAANALFRQVRPPQYYAERIRRTGFALNLKALDLGEDEFMLAARTAGTIRERITVLDIAAQAGVLEDAAADALALMN